MRLTRTIACFSLILVALAPELAAAQTNSSQRAIARRLFNEGVTAAQSNDWATASEKWQRSYDLDPRVNTLFNIAGAQVNTNDMVGAVENYKEFLSRSTGEEQAELRGAAQTAVAELEPRIPHVTVTAENFGEGDALVLNGEELSSLVIGERIPLNPGSYELQIVRRGEPVATRTFSLLEGAHRPVNIRAAELPQPVEAVVPTPAATAAAAGANGGQTAQPTRPRTPREESTSVAESPVFWVVVGALVIGGGVAAGLYLTRGQEDAFMGDFGAGTVTID